MRDSIELSHAIPADVDPLGYFDLFGIRFLRVIPMAGKSRPMSQIKQLIRLKQQGYAIKAIARCLSLSKNTVKTYLSRSVRQSST